MRYKLICVEELVGEGPVYWYGEQEYNFEKEQVLKFIEERLPLGGLNNPLFNEDGSQTEQYLVTHSIQISVE